ncbi:hypothetical protein MKW94_027463 [Papaver nudicaule]|uniref:PUM-HD domain-containing protein n=1 Tax=Papaver nudicaule TaxID=74823 RepID=A0AA42AY06_PAPNU|nr:hypothetical protein [Papaver nudicaule]
MANWNRGRGSTADHQGAEEEDDEQERLVVNNSNGGVYNYPPPQHNPTTNFLRIFLRRSTESENHLQDLYPDFPYGGGLVPFPPLPPTLVPGSSPCIRRNAEYYEMIKRDRKHWHLLVDMAKDRFGKKFISGRLENGGDEDIQFIIGALTSHIKKLMVDSFGNLLVQKMFLKCMEGQIGETVNILTNNGHELINICLDTHGSKSVQKLLDSLTSGQQITKVMNVLTKGTVELTKDPNGHHVIQQCLKTFSNEENKHLFRALAKNCVDIARDQNGYCVFQSFILKTDKHLRAQFVGEITQNALVLAQDPYGNYVVQYVVGQKIKEATRSLAKNLAYMYLYVCNLFQIKLISHDHMTAS